MTAKMRLLNGNALIKATNKRVIITSKRYNLSSKTPVLPRLAYVLSYVQGVSVISASYCSFFC